MHEDRKSYDSREDDRSRAIEVDLEPLKHGDQIQPADLDKRFSCECGEDLEWTCEDSYLGVGHGEWFAHCWTCDAHYTARPLAYEVERN